MYKKTNGHWRVVLEFFCFYSEQHDEKKFITVMLQKWQMLQNMPLWHTFKFNKIQKMRNEEKYTNPDKRPMLQTG